MQLHPTPSPSIFRRTLTSDIERLISYSRIIHRLHPAGNKWGSGGVARAGKFLLRGLVHWRSVSDWLHFVETTGLATAAIDIRRELADKIFRPYAYLASSVASKRTILCDHYGILSDSFRDEALSRIVNDHPIVLCDMTGAEEQHRFRLALTRNRLFQQQGELTISLIDQTSGAPLATLAINLYRNETDKPVMLLSGLQGPSAPFGKEDIVAATRTLDGLRPKRLVVEGAYALARRLAADRIIAVGRANHVSSVRGKRWRDIRADYDGFWQELGAQPRADGNYDMPPVLHRRSPEEIPAKRRRETLRRYQRLDDITRCCAAELERLAPAPE